MTRRRFHLFFFAVVAALYLVLGSIGLLAPEWLLSGYGVVVERPVAFLELRGAYGGLNLAIGGYLLFSLVTRAAARSGLILITVVNTGYAGGRIYSLIYDGVFSFTLFLILLAQLAVIGAALWLMTRQPSAWVRQR